jgi:hypothetical protein
MWFAGGGAMIIAVRASALSGRTLHPKRSSQALALEGIGAVASAPVPTSLG